jgi:hypothetical protein
MAPSTQQERKKGGKAEERQRTKALIQDQREYYAPGKLSIGEYSSDGNVLDEDDNDDDDEKRHSARDGLVRATSDCGFAKAK